MTGIIEYNIIFNGMTELVYPKYLFNILFRKTS